MLLPMTVRGPWYITTRAVSDYLTVLGRDPDSVDDDAWYQAESELISMAEETVASGRRPKRMRTGAWRYRGPRPLRLSLIVVDEPRPEGPLPQLVRVEPSHEVKASGRFRSS